MSREVGRVGSSGGRIMTRRTVRTVAGAGPSKDTPWGVSLKPVPRKVVTEVVTEQLDKTDSKPPKSKTTSARPVKSILIKKTAQKSEHVEMQVIVWVSCFGMN